MKGRVKGERCWWGEMEAERKRERLFVFTWWRFGGKVRDVGGERWRSVVPILERMRNGNEMKSGF